MQAARPDIEELANALIALGKAAGALTRIEEELPDVLSLMADAERIRKFMADPAIRTEGKRRVIEELVGIDVHPVLVNFLCILVDENKLTGIRDIAQVFFTKVAGVKPEAGGELVTARPLTPEKTALIENETGRLLGKTVSLRVRVDPKLLGGLYVRVGDFVIDGTVDSQLDALREKLLA